MAFEFLSFLLSRDIEASHAAIEQIFTCVICPIVQAPSNIGTCTHHAHNTDPWNRGHSYRRDVQLLQRWTLRHAMIYVYGMPRTRSLGCWQWQALLNDLIKRAQDGTGCFRLNYLPQLTWS